jgi:hypothetical protein
MVPPHQAAKRRRDAKAAAARQPSNSTAMTNDVNTTKLAATPAEVALRNSIPTATVHNHTTTPVGKRAIGRRQARDASHPNAVPLRNGHAVVAIPAMLIVSS